MAGVPWSTSFPFILWVPGVGLPYYAGCRFAAGTVNPPLAPLENLYLYWLRSHLLPQVLVADNIRPAYLKDPFEADVP